MYRRWWEQFVQDVPVDVLEGTGMLGFPEGVPCLGDSSLSASSPENGFPHKSKYKPFFRSTFNSVLS